MTFTELLILINLIGLIVCSVVCRLADKFVYLRYKDQKVVTK